MVPDLVAARDGVRRTMAPVRGSGLTPGPRPLRLPHYPGGVCPPAAGGSLTRPSRFAQSDTICAGRSAEGSRTVDMKAATVAAVAKRIGGPWPC